PTRRSSDLVTAAASRLDTSRCTCGRPPGIRLEHSLSCDAVDRSPMKKRLLTGCESQTSRTPSRYTGKASPCPHLRYRDRRARGVARPRVCGASLRWRPRAPGRRGGGEVGAAISGLQGEAPEDREGAGRRGVANGVPCLRRTASRCTAHGMTQGTLHRARDETRDAAPGTG